MDRNTTVKLLKNLDVTELSGEKVMVDFESGKYFLIKGAGNDIWDLIQDEITMGQIVDTLVAEYDVEPDVCQESVEKFLHNLDESGLVSLARV